jgi:hypothetical protein
MMGRVRGRGGVSIQGSGWKVECSSFLKKLLSAVIVVAPGDYAASVIKYPSGDHVLVHVSAQGTHAGRQAGGRI